MYAVETYLPDTLSSLQNQSFADLQIVLVDDGSPDNVAAIAREAAAVDARVVYVHQQNRGPGPGGGRNGGLKSATGDYLMFVDADDVIAAHTLEVMMEAALRTRADLVTCNSARLVGGAVHNSEFHDLGHRVDIENTTAAESPWLMFDSTPWNKIFRREFFDRVVGSWPEQVLYEDIAMMTRAHLRSTSTAVISEPLYYWRVRGAGQITQKTDSIAADLEQLRELRNGAAEVARWGDATLLDWFSWKAYGFDLSWMTRKLARIAPATANELAADIRLTMDQLSTRAFNQLPERTRRGFELVDQVERRTSRAKLMATNWRLTPVHRGLDVVGRDPTADLLRWKIIGDEIELSIQVDSAAHGTWQLELGARPLLLAPEHEPLAVVVGEQDRARRPDRTMVRFRLPLDLEPIVGALPLVHLGVSTTTGAWRGEIGRSLRDKVAGRLGKPRATVSDASSAVPFFVNNRLKLALIAPGSGVLVANTSAERIVFTIGDELAQTVDSIGLYSEHQHEPFDLDRDDPTTWSLPLDTVVAALADGHTLLALAAGMKTSPSVPVPLRGQPSIEIDIAGGEVFLGGYGQVFIRPEASLRAEAAPLLQYLRRRRSAGA